jgi:hypothetical protein
LRTVVVPVAERSRYLEWIADGRAVREAQSAMTSEESR